VAWLCGGTGGEDAQDDFAALGELDGVAEEVENDLAESDGVAAVATGDAVGEVEDELEGFLAGESGLEIEGALELFVEIEIDGLEDEAAGLDLGEVEDVVDDGKERLAAEEESVDEILLFVGERGAEEKMSHSDDAVERGADLVAHVGEEDALGLVGGLGGLLGDLECGVGGMELVGAEEDALFEGAVELAVALLAGGEGGGFFGCLADLDIELAVGGVELGCPLGDEVREPSPFAALEIGDQPEDEGAGAQCEQAIEGERDRGAEPRRANDEGDCASVPIRTPESGRTRKT
jgi:hypothetical protein